jgi:phosphate transport system protein
LIFFSFNSQAAEMKLHPKTVMPGTNLVILLKHLERISDNIAEYVYFMVNAKIIKHDKHADLNL